MYNFLLVFIGGGLGSMARFGVAQLVVQKSTGFPWATFLANAISCIILGLLLGYQIKNGLGNNGKLLLMTGFCGGFSTFSTFGAETLSLLQSNQFGMAFLYIGASVALCLLALFIGIKLIYLN